jgi:hypothetical protein
LAAGWTPGGILAKQAQTRGRTILLLGTLRGRCDVATENKLTAMRERGRAHAV